MNYKDRYMSLCSQYSDGNNQKHESVMIVKSFPKNTPVNIKSLFNYISKKTCSNFLSQYAQDTVFLNTRKRLQFINIWLIILVRQ